MLLYAFISGGEAMVGRAIVGVILIVADPAGCPTASCPAIQQLADAAAARRPGRGAAPRWRRSCRRQPPIGDARILQVRGVAKRFGGLQALGGVDLDVREGEILGLVGPNGSGKTTLINVISGFYPLTQRHRSRSTASRSAACRRTRSPAAAWRAPTRSRGRSRT